MTNQLFETNLNSLSDRLFSFALKLTKSKDAAMDLYQETAFKAFKKRDTFKTGSNFKAWITTIMYNTFVNDYRKRRRRNVADAPVEELTYALETTNIYPSVNSQIAEKEIIEQVKKLKPAYQGPLNMFISGYKYQEIADAHNIPMGTVKSRINYARKTLKEKLTKLRVKAA